MDKVLDRDRLVILAALAAVVALAWAYLAYIVVAQPAMDMDAIAMAAMPPPVWNIRYFAATLAMWMVMMVGMMLPSAAPTVLLFDALQMHGDPSRRATALFAAGYVLAWAAFSILATTAQWALSEAMLLSAMMTGKSPIFTAALLVIAGVYQFTRWKTACLRQCRSPVEFLVRHRRSGALGPLLMGLQHGIQCIGCCWALMALLFAFGVMNLVWVAALAIFVFIEKLTPAGPAIGRVGGVLLVCAGLVMMAVG
jgi:Predicted metal-binding integral membrane protein